MGSDGSNSHAMPPMFDSHLGGSGAAVGDKFLVVGGSDHDGKVLDVLCRQQIKLFQVVSTSEFHEY